jgi:3',5'-cyclic AMP phosphodiesterase CpdA
MLVEAMLSDATSLAAERPFDLVVFSGDLANEGGNEELKLAEGLLFRPVLERFGLGLERLILVPGNHDVERDKIRR